MSKPIFFDITPVISPSLGVFPGDKSFEQKFVLDFPKNHLSLSQITTTVHLGAHADSPYHYHSSGATMEQVDLFPYIGLCQVIHASAPDGSRVYPADLEGQEILAPRVLICTGSFPDPEHWNSDFQALSPELIQYLSQKGVRLVGIDTPSIDPEQSKQMESHQAIYQCRMSVLEGLVLSDVPEGLYTLVALPLKIKGSDASPVRAVLFSTKDLESSF